MDRIDEAVEVALAAYVSSRGSYEGEVPASPDDIRAALLASLPVLLGNMRPAIMDVEYDRVALVESHDDYPVHGIKNVWVVDAPSLGEGDGR